MKEEDECQKMLYKQGNVRSKLLTNRELWQQKLNNLLKNKKKTLKETIFVKKIKKKKKEIIVLILKIKTKKWYKKTSFLCCFYRFIFIRPLFLQSFFPLFYFFSTIIELFIEPLFLCFSFFLQPNKKKVWVEKNRWNYLYLYGKKRICF